MKRFFLPSGGSCTCGRKKRQAASPNKGKDEPNTKWAEAYDAKKTSHAIWNRFFGNLFGGNDQNCGACCYSQGYNQGASNYNNQGFNHGSSNQAGRCQCDYSKTFTDQNGRTHGGCRRSAFIFTVKEKKAPQIRIFLNFQSWRVWAHLVLHNWMG